MCQAPVLKTYRKLSTKKYIFGVMRWNFWLNRLECSNSEARTHFLKLSTGNIHNLYLLLEVSHELKRWLAENRPLQNKCSNFALVSLKKGNKFSPDLLKPYLITNLWLKSGYCAVQHASFWFSMCVLMNGSCKFFRESSKPNAVERQGACNNTVHKPIIREKMQTSTEGNQRFKFILCKI
jgi:hypothetical protein